MRAFDKWSCMSEPQSDMDCIEALQGVLACLRQQYLMYQNAHWQATGETFYSSHLLFQRLYEGDEEDDTDGGVAADVDAVAERMVGLFGTPSVDMDKLMPKMLFLCRRWCRVTCHHRRALAAEADLQRCISEALKACEAEGRLTLGLDNLLQDIADKHEVNMYLIQQVLRHPGE